VKRTVFYSWQSDLPGNGNRNLIETCLTRALEAIGKDATTSIEPVLDRDTAGIAGAPDIATSIFSKIARADVFVADVSIINSGAGMRSMPNPNVLFELGYAVAELGWENVILVQNDAFGGPADLPFDLRGRRTVVYRARDGFDRAEVRGLLQGRLETALRSALTGDSQGTLPSGRDAQLWWGRWGFRFHGAYWGDLFVREVSPDGFLFDISVGHGAHMGALTGTARIVSKDLAYARIPNGNSEGPGELVFRRGRDGGRRVIEVVEAISCMNWHGMRATFTGSFENRPEPWFQAGVMSELDLSRLYALVGAHLDHMRDRAGDIALNDDLDGLGATVVSGGVAGMYTDMESIVMQGSRGGLWCAYIDGDVVRYFTNSAEWYQKLPKTIEQWRSRFASKPVVFEGRVDAIPSDAP
jgi:hypothetical protein